MSQRPDIWLDGSPTATLPLPDRGSDFGDGVFETILVHQGALLFADVHLERLSLGLQVLAIPDCIAAARQQLDIVAIAIHWRWAVLRLSVSRGSGQRGYTPSDNAVPRILISVSPLDRDCEKMMTAATLCFANIRLATQPFLAGIKHLNRLEQVLASAQAKAEGVDEAIVLDQNGHIVSVIAGNIFLVRQGKLLTPKLDNCGVLGTRRRLVIERWAPAIGLTVRETTLTLLDLQEAEEVFYSNSLQTVRPIARIGQQSWNSHGVCEAIFQRYQETLI
ncbi:MAG: aminodeoxychorismate lyase [Halioglobus sp.]